MSRFCPSYAAYSVTESCRIALFQQLVYCIGADSADSTDSEISVTRLGLVSVSRLKRLGIVLVSASYVSITTLGFRLSRLSRHVLRTLQIRDDHLTVLLSTLHVSSED